MPVYFIQAAEAARVKIGYSADPPGRLDELSTGSPVPLALIAVMPGDPSDEAQLHERFAADRTHGEWFRRSPEIEAFIAEMIEQHGAPAARGRRQRGPGLGPGPMQPLRDFLNSAGLSAAEFARQIGAKPITVYFWLHGQRRPRAAFFGPIRAASGLQLHQLRPDLFGDQPGRAA